MCERCEECISGIVNVLYNTIQHVYILYSILCIFDYSVLNLNYNTLFIQHAYTMIHTVSTTTVPTNTTTADTSVATTVGRGHPPLPGGVS